MAILWVNGVECPTPTAFTCGLTDVSSSDAGRTDDSMMHKNRIAQKRSLSLAWNNARPEVVAKVMQMFNPEYFQVTYPDAMSGTNETRTFYAGDRSAAMRHWFDDNKMYSSLSFNVIER